MKMLIFFGVVFAERKSEVLGYRKLYFSVVLNEKYPSKV